LSGLALDRDFLAGMLRLRLRLWLRELVRKRDAEREQAEQG
jgi:hypothetical protein